MTEACENSDHDGFQAPATVRISDSSTTTLRCTYCAEGWMTSLIRKGRPSRLCRSLREPDLSSALALLHAVNDMHHKHALFLGAAVVATSCRESIRSDHRLNQPSTEGKSIIMHDHDAELLELFVEFQRSGNRAQRTIDTRLSLLRGFAARQEVDLLTATVFHLRREVGRDVVAPSTKATTRAVFRSFYTFLHEEGLRPDNPSLRLPVVKVPKHRPRPYTPEQIDRLLSTGAYKRTRAMILLSAYEGLRASEIAAVHSDDIDLESGTLKVIGKGNRTDYLPLHPTIVELAPTMASGWWFPARRGREGHIHGRSVSTLLTDAKKRAGIADRNLTGHSLRHAFGTELVRRGANIRAVQELMRHESLQTTQRYTEVLDEDRRSALAVLPPRPVLTRSGRGVTAA